MSAIDLTNSEDFTLVGQECLAAALRKLDLKLPAQPPKHLSTTKDRPTMVFITKPPQWWAGTNVKAVLSYVQDRMVAELSKHAKVHYAYVESMRLSGEQELRGYGLILYV